MQVDTHTSFDTRLAEAQVLFQANKPGSAEALLRTLQARDPSREDAAMLLAEVLRSQGRLDAASNTVFDLCGANGFQTDVSLRSARFAQQCDRHTIATRICEQALARATSPCAELLVQAGHVAREVGDFTTARAHYLAALECGADLEHSHVLGALSNTKRYTDPADPDLARCEQHFHDRSYSARSRASAGFGLAKIQDDLGEYKEAARTLREANEILHEVLSWNAATWRAFVYARLGERVADGSDKITDDFVPIFIVGLPRSGTTLTATLLAGASGARDRGELRLLRFIADRLVAGGHLGNQPALAEAATLYRMFAVQDDMPAKYYIDQDPMNFRWLHVVAALFPQARVIHMRRDRRDTALSLWSQDFAHQDLAFAYNFSTMIEFMAGHDLLMQHWKQTLPLPIFELDYETLVAETKQAVAELCRFIGALARELCPRGGAAPVQSASVWQARQPIYSTSIGRWKHYARYMPELASFERQGRRDQL